MEKSKLLFFVAEFGYRWEVGLLFERPYPSIFLSAGSDNIKSVERNKENYRKIENNFFRLLVWISVGSRSIFRKALKFPIYPYFCRLGLIILNQLKKIKKTIEKSNIFFSALGLDIGGKQAYILKGLKIPYPSIFLLTCWILLSI